MDHDNDRADAPEALNREQEESEQAQDIAEAARGLGDDPAEDSSHGGRSDPAAMGGEDAQDLVDHMEAMVTGGRIDYSAYRGERNDDDEPDSLGDAAVEPSDRF